MSRRTTVSDMVSHLRDYLGTNVNNEAQRVILRSIQAAYRELTNVRRWSYLYDHGRIQINGAYSTGTVDFDYTGGANERQLTLAGGTWPSWAANGAVRIGQVTYDVDRRISNTVLTLDDTLTPVADIASGTSYTIYQDTYSMPEDFVGSGPFYPDEAWGGLQWIHPSEWLRTTRYYQSSASLPRFYSFRGSPDVPGRMAISLFPYPDTNKTLDFIYHRRPRPIALVSYSTGTATTSASSTTVTGSGTTWTSSMVGAILRISSSTTDVPTGFEGSNVYAVERNIRVFTSATSLTVDESIDTTYTAVKYEVSDPLDIEDGAMLEAYYRCAEKHVSLHRHLKDSALAIQAYQDQLVKAEEADSRSFQGRVAGEGRTYRLRLSEMPRGSDIS